MIDLWSQINHVVPFVCFLVPITRMRSSNLSRIETNLPYCLIAGVQCDDVQNHTGLSSLVRTYVIESLGMGIRDQVMSDWCYKTFSSPVKITVEKSRWPRIRV